MELKGSEYSELISNQLQRTASDLRKLQETLTFEGIDPRVLLDFREAVDNIRHVAWAVQQWLELHEKREDVSSVMSVLAAHRVRVATQLVTDLAIGLESGEVDHNTAGLNQLAEAIARLTRAKTSDR